MQSSVSGVTHATKWQLVISHLQTILIYHESTGLGLVSNFGKVFIVYTIFSIIVNN